MRFINTGPCHLLLLPSWLKQLSRSSSQADLPALLCCKPTKAASTQAVGASPPLACRQITFHTKLAASEIRSAHLERLLRPRWSAVRGCCGRCARQVRHLGLHKRQQKKAEQSALKQAILGAHTQVLASDWGAAGRAPCWRPARPQAAACVLPTLAWTHPAPPVRLDFRLRKVQPAPAAEHTASGQPWTLTCGKASAGRAGLRSCPAPGPYAQPLPGLPVQPSPPAGVGPYAHVGEPRLDDV